ncbi:E3 ubiquitin-protein ligase TRIM39 [Gasterosteus aculeatus]
MASSVLSEDQLLCPICLDVLTRPVSTPCGHNFCMSCITRYWDDIPVGQCPVCKATFESRPDLKVNTFISELASKFMSLQVAGALARRPDRRQAGCGAAVRCDVCTDAQGYAVRSCLECLTSYCDVHLEPHHRAAGLKRHTLVEPLASLEDKICKDHGRLVTQFCRNDGALLCDVCPALHHANHDVVPALQEHQRVKALLGDTEAKVQQMIQERLQKVGDAKAAVEQGKTETKDAIESSVRDLTALVSDIQKTQTQFVKVIEEEQRAAEERAVWLISGLEREITELQSATLQLRDLKKTEDTFSFLQSSLNPFPLPHTIDVSAITFTGPVEIRRVQSSFSQSVSQLQTALAQMSAEIKSASECTAELRYAQQYEVDVVLDPDTAHPLLILSGDGKQVRYVKTAAPSPNPKPGRFVEHLAVLGKSGFSSPRFYFEVFVGGKIEWCVGVAEASVQRRALVPGPCCGLWAISFLHDKFETFNSPNVTVHVGKVERVGVFVDCCAGRISFYDVQTATLIYSFTECVCSGELHPYFNPCDDEYGPNFGPMMVVPVDRTV